MKSIFRTSAKAFLLLLLMSGNGECQDSQFHLQGYSIIVSEHGIFSMSCPDMQIDKYECLSEFRRPTWLTVAHNGMNLYMDNIIQLLRRIGKLEPKYDHIYTTTPLFYTSSCDSTNHMIESLNNQGFYCVSMDYSIDSKEYAFSGKYDDDWGIKILDTLFNVSHDVSKLLEKDVKFSRHAKVRYIYDNRIVVSIRNDIYEDETYIVDIDKGIVDTIISGYFCGVSNNDSIIVIGDENNKCRLLWLDNLSEIYVDGLKHSSKFVFSPDDKQVAYFEVETQEGIQQWISRLYVYDIETRETLKTNFRFGESSSFCNVFIWK